MRKRTIAGCLAGLASFVLAKHLRDQKRGTYRTDKRPVNAEIMPPHVGPVKIQVVNEGWHAEEKKHREEEKQYWRKSRRYSVLTIIIAALAFGAAAGAYWQSQRQADAAEKFAPRAWLYAEVIPVDKRAWLQRTDCSQDEFVFTPFTCIRKVRNANGTSYLTNFVFNLHNYGLAPATIINIRAYLYTLPIPPVPNSIFDESGNVIKIANVTSADNLTESIGVTLAQNALIQTSAEASFTLFSQHGGGESFGFFPHWIQLIIDYRDPYRGDRQTSLMIETRLGELNTVINPKYSYQH